MIIIYIIQNDAIWLEISELILIFVDFGDKMIGLALKAAASELRHARTDQDIGF